jgi:hypothetical protein
MKTYERTAAVGSVNLLFDQAMYSLHDDLAGIIKVLGDSGVPWCFAQASFRAKRFT